MFQTIKIAPWDRLLGYKRPDILIKEKKFLSIDFKCVPCRQKHLSFHSGSLYYQLITRISREKNYRVAVRLMNKIRVGISWPLALKKIS